MIERINSITFFVWISFLPVWLAWECVLLWLRGEKITVATISMVARDRGWQLNFVVYLWGGMGTHWWVNGDNWAPVWTATAFWVISAALLASDVANWGAPKEWRPWWRLPALWLAVGTACGAILFQQRSA